MSKPALFCRTHDSYYQPPRCSPLCTLLASWSDSSPVFTTDSSPGSRAEQQESGDLCREAAVLYGSHPDRR